ncbi:uncharacterized protein LOC122570846 [Bombus pyrosoma]|uniref:uncharacterized protein LOC122570846 n=1 Tax=Bombus pyrosoma TaxID=396416 RepID=UPI001CB8DBF8|nr:uncharacterized protein LOC122570846 [Bombus pyrosoma]
MLVFFTALIVSTLNSATGVEHQFLSSSLARSKRGVVETGHNVLQDYKSHQIQSVGPNMPSIGSSNAKSPTHYKNVQIVKESPLVGGSIPLAYGDTFKQSSPYATSPLPVYSFESRNNERLLPYSDNLFTMSTGYKTAGGDFAKPLKQAGTHRQPKINQNITTDTNLQVPVYKTDYLLPKISASQSYAPMFQNEKASLPMLQVQKGRELPQYLSSAQSQPLVLNPVDQQFNFAVRMPKLNSVQLSTPFLTPLSSFQGQVVPISTVDNNAQFPQYKGAAVDVYPTVSSFSPMAYQPIQPQSRLHFVHDNVQRVQSVDNVRHATPAQEIRSDVEIIDKKKPAPPPKTDDDDEDDVDNDEDYVPREKQYGTNSEEDDDYETRSGKYFKAPATEGNFKPSTSFPFKQYDEKFGKYSSQNRNVEGDDKKPKYHDHSSSNDEDDDEQAPSAKYNSDLAPSKSFYSRQEDEENDDRHGYERQKTEETSDDGNASKYLDKNIDEEFEASYRKKLPRQEYIHLKEVPEVEYGSSSSKGNGNDYEDPSGEGSFRNFRYFKNFHDFKDSEGFNSDIVKSFSMLPETTYGGSFGYKIPERNAAS